MIPELAWVLILVFAGETFTPPQIIHMLTKEACEKAIDEFDRAERARAYCLNTATGEVLR